MEFFLHANLSVESCKSTFMHINILLRKQTEAQGFKRHFKSWGFTPLRA